MGIGTTLYNAGSSALGGIKSAGSAVGSFVADNATKFANSAAGQAMGAVLGNVDKAVIEIADFSERKVEETEAKKPGGGIKGLTGFDPGLAESCSNRLDQAKKAAKDTGVQQEEAPFDVYNDYKKYRFEVPFNPAELTISGYGGEEIMVQNFSNSDIDKKEDEKPKEDAKDPEQHKPPERSNAVKSVDSHIELNIPLIFDKTNNQDAFFADKYSLNTTSIARGVGKGLKNRKKETSPYSVQKEVEAFTYIIRSSSMRLMSFTWGDMSYQGILNGVNAEYTMFNVNGEPCRATVNLRLVLLDSEFPDQLRIWRQKLRSNVGAGGQSGLVNQAKNLAAGAH